MMVQPERLRMMAHPERLRMVIQPERLRMVIQPEQRRKQGWHGQETGHRLGYLVTGHSWGSGGVMNSWLLHGAEGIGQDIAHEGGGPL
jgi:hypothetical protein